MWLKIADMYGDLNLLIGFFELLSLLKIKAKIKILYCYHIAALF